MGRSKYAADSFAALEPRIHHVSAAKIKKKWTRLSPTSQSHLRELLTSLEQHTKQQQSTRKLSKNAEAEKVVKQVMEKLVERLPRMPFPPSASEENFDFEMNLHRIRSIEEQLASNTHAAKLLCTQIKHEARQLEEDKHEVMDLEESLRSNDVHRSQRLKTLHQLARSMAMSKGTKNNFEDQYARTEVTSLDWHALDADAAIQPHLSKLRSHMNSINSNKESLQKVMSALIAAKTPLLRVQLHQSSCA